MSSLTITDAAYSRIQRELAGSPIESPITRLVHSARATLPPYAMLRAIDLTRAIAMPTISRCLRALRFYGGARAQRVQVRGVTLDHFQMDLSCVA